MTIEQSAPSKAGKGPPSAITIAISVLAHVLLLAPVIYIVVLSVQTYSTFSWHVICSAIGIGFFMLEAIFCVSGEAYISSKLSRKSRVILHWVLQTVGFGLLLVCMIVIIVLKENYGSPHFVSTHGKLGLAATILCAVLMINGICTDKYKWFYPRIKPVTIKIVHGIGGIIVMVILLATVINGTYTHWWKAGTIARNLTFASFVIGTALIMIKPILGAASRTKMVFCRPSTNR